MEVADLIPGAVDEWALWEEVSLERGEPRRDDDLPPVDPRHGRGPPQPTAAARSASSGWWPRSPADARLTPGWRPGATHVAMSAALRRLRGVPLELSRTDARRLAVLGQMLSAPQPRTIAEVVTGSGRGADGSRPPSIARTEHLVLWSRLGKRFKVADLERMLWEERSLFEYWAHIVPTADFGIHRDAMRRYLAGDATRHTYVRDWLAANAAFRRYVLRELRAPRPAAHARPRGPHRRGLAHRRLERRGPVHRR